MKPTARRLGTLGLLGLALIALAQCAGSPGRVSVLTAKEGTFYDKAYDQEFYKNYGVNPFIYTQDENRSTFALDVDTGSFDKARAVLREGKRPDPDGVRVEEFVNAFNYRYAPPTKGGDFRLHVEAAPSPFGPDGYQLLRIGLKAREVAASERKRARLTLVIDTSGSMAQTGGVAADKMPRLDLVKAALRRLVQNLSPEDQVGLVAYDTQARVILPPTRVSERAAIEGAISRLASGGSTNAEAGLRLGYDMALEQFKAGSINRVIFCSDGVANVGKTGADGLYETIKDAVDRGVTLTCVGVGMGTFNDVLLEQLAQKGNGNFAYVDSVERAGELFGQGLVSTLQLVARDAKVQVEFDTDQVKRFRLIGYENRVIENEQFTQADGGEVGPGHSVTALYEFAWAKDAPRTGPVATIRILYHRDGDETDQTASYTLQRKQVGMTFDGASRSLRLAAVVAEFAEILRNSHWAKGSELGSLLPLLERLKEETDADKQIIDLSDLVRRAADND